jgi:hypothetical protein
LLTNSALVYESQWGVSANEYKCAHHVTWSPPYLTYGEHLCVILQGAG